MKSSVLRPSLFAHRPSASGAIFIVAMWVLVVLVGLVLVLGQTMRVESISSANDLSSLQAQGVEQGAIQYVLYNLASLQGQMPLDANMPCEAVQIGQGAFWILRSNDTTDDFTYCFGVTDECAKVNLNPIPPIPGFIATDQLNMFEMLPDMTSELAPCIIDWQSASDTPSSGGAKDEYYATLPDPYTCKKARLETVEELFLVKGADEDIMYGEDVNRNGVLETYKDNNKDGKLDRGLFPFVTVYSVSPNTDANGGKRVSVNGPPVPPSRDKTGKIISQTYSPNGALATQLQKKLSASSYNAVIARLTALLTKNQNALLHSNIYDFYNKSGMTIDDFKLVADSLMGNSTSTSGLINVVTAPKEVLMCLPGLVDSDASALIAKRITLGASSSSSTSAGGGAGLSNSRLSGAMNSSGGLSGLSSGSVSSSISTADLYNPWWVAEAISGPKAATIGSRITTRTSRYSADIVSVSGNGRSFRRCRIVVDAQKTPTVIYRQDLTHLGWPLAPEILTALKSGKTVDQLPLTSTGREVLK
jgi:type II secretory pathway component PulK